jgi:tripartite-type tricarboxylate transporter receptor subunit TctC
VIPSFISFPNMTNSLTRRALCALALAATGLAHAAYPERPITLVVPYVPVSPADVVARTLGEGLGRRLGQTVIVENKPGGNTQIGAVFVARAKADGYTLVLGNMDSHAINPLLYKNLPFDVERDFAPVVPVVTSTTMLIASPGLAAKNGAELIAAAKAQPEKLTYGSWGLGSVAHLWGVLLEQSAGVQLYHVPYQGSPAAMTALMGNQIDLMFTAPALAVAGAQQGKLKIIGSTSAQRLPQYPDIPTLAEQGFRGYEGSTWFGVFAPAGTPADVLAKLNTEFNAVLRSPETATRFATLSMVPQGGTREALAQMQRDSRGKWARIIADRKIQLD